MGLLLYSIQIMELYLSVNMKTKRSVDLAENLMEKKFNKGTFNSNKQLHTKKRDQIIKFTQSSKNFTKDH